MGTVGGLLAVLEKNALREEVDRVGAAVGLRVIHVADPASVTVRSWLAPVAVLLDAAAAARCIGGIVPRRPAVMILTGSVPTEATWQAAVTLGAEHVLNLPTDGDTLVRLLADAGDAARDGGQRHGEVVAVVGGRGGAGASLFAAALAQAATNALLIDLDPWGGGIDLLVGSEDASGLRWPDLSLRGGRLTWPAVRDALPRHPTRPGVAVLSGGRCGFEPDGAAVGAVIDAGRRGGTTVVCDLPRAATESVETALNAADLVVLMTPCDVRSCAASAAIGPRLRAVNPSIGMVVRGPSPGGLRAAELAELAGLPLLTAMRAEPRLTDRLEHGGLRVPQRSALMTAARRVLAVLPPRRSPDVQRGAG